MFNAIKRIVMDFLTRINVNSLLLNGWTDKDKKNAIYRSKMFCGLNLLIVSTTVRHITTTVNNAQTQYKPKERGIACKKVINLS